MGSHCPATLEIIEQEAVNVTYYKTHVGHEKDLRHIFLSKADKEELSGKLLYFFSRYYVNINESLFLE